MKKPRQRAIDEELVDLGIIIGVKSPQPKARKSRLPRPKVSRLEAKFDLMCRFLPPTFPLIVREYQFDANRKWRFDRCIPTRRIAIELEGGTWAGGRHTRGAGFEKDCEKYAEATAQGWRVLRFTTKFIEDGRALEWLRRTLLLEI